MLTCCSEVDRIETIKVQLVENLQKIILCIYPKYEHFYEDSYHSVDSDDTGLNCGD